MRSERLQDAIGEVKNEYIEDAEMEVRIKKRTWIRWAAAAACLCLIAAGTVFFLNKRPASSEIAQWSEKMTAAEYFRNSGKGNGSGSSAEADLVMAPYAVAVLFSDERGRLEADGVIPQMTDHPEQSFMAAYNGDGSLYKVDLWWMRRGESLEEYSDLRLTAAPEELHEISDTVYIPVDEFGNEIPAYVTVTERDGIRIYAEGRENENKTIIWKTDKAWYRISGSFKDSYEDMVALLDWFWAHPLDIALFEGPGEDVLIYTNRAEQPDAFEDIIPGFESLGYAAEFEKVNLGHAYLAPDMTTPVWFEGVYTRGDTRIKWTINTGADADAWAANLGRISELTEEKVKTAIEQKGYFNIFFDRRASDKLMPCMVTLTVEQGTAEDAWEIIESMR